MSARDQRVGTSHLDRVEVESCRFGRFSENPEPSRCRNDLKVHTLEYGVVRWGCPETPPQNGNISTPQLESENPLSCSSVSRASRQIRGFFPT